MSKFAWRLYAVSVAVGVAAYAVVPDGPWWRSTWQGLFAYVPAAALIAGARTVRRGARLPWWTLAAASVVSGVASALDNFGITVLSTTPDLSDILFLSFYPLFAAGLIMMIVRLRHRMDWTVMVDAFTVTVGAGLMTWVYAIDPAFDAGGPIRALALKVAYPIGDLALLALTVLLLRCNGPHGGAAPRWIAACIVFYLAGDWAWVAVGVHPSWDTRWTERGIDAMYMASLCVLGFAGRQPRIDDEGPDAPAISRLSVPQLILVALGVLIAPTLLFLESAAHEVSDGYAIAVGSATMFALVVGRMAQLLRQSERQSRQVRDLSRRDELTGLPNRRAWTDELPRALQAARRDRAPISIGLLDLDRFKQFNDHYGHPAGDRLLKEAAAAWSASLRRGDTLARYGGEEFIVLLPGADVEQAVQVLDRVRTATPQGQTFSAGVATWDGEEISDDLIIRADVALYAAKAAGRDRVLMASTAQT